MPVDIISADQLAKVTAGMKTGKKENPKPLVEKVAEAKPRRRRRRQDHREAAGRDRHRAAAAAEGRGKAGREEARSAEAGRRAQAEGRAEADREEAGSAEGRSDRGSAEEGREEAAAEAAGPRRAKPPEPPKPKAERDFDQSKIAALLDKRDPTRQAVAGDTLNSNAALGLAKGKAADNSATWGAMFKAAGRALLEEALWRARGAEARGRFQHPSEARRHAGRHAGRRTARRRPPMLRVYQESALARDHRVPAV